ncbi:MAG: cupin domain-containing protein [Gammaproteobacteria bacterium]|nr:cupin domain-containing protein [Gammaproteobacteria bacterium]MBT5406929.1 cupin domain-containing protein [Gammaproteobacteria bacterium]MBT5643763.1 cupin domain-containing protein [Gammaproteobacteria bacterium]MBT5863935.1 cupin domain-containing protein [Gammaproteobacteria bacterium]MBT6733825.1 cupin domain-containing protein [Gammaproteobacteria bacterium]
MNINDIGGSITKEDDRYIVKDNNLLKNLVVSSTDLKPMKSTSGHEHKGQEEVYFFVKGNGRMELDGREINVDVGDTVLIEDGVFHRVHAGPQGCYFVCVFDGKRSH